MLTFRLKAPDADRLTAVLDSRGLAVSDWLRAVALDALDADLDATPAPME